MKYVCPGCDRLVEVSAFRIDAGTLVLRCLRCGEESRAGPDSAPFAAPVAAPPPRPASAAGPNVVQLRPGTSEGIRLAAEVAESGDPFGVPPGRCPKCVAPRPESAQSCPSCGLTYDLYEPEALVPTPGLADRWTGLLAEWGDAGLHEQLVREAVARGELAAVGRLYRLRLAACPEDPIAMHGRDEVVRLATAHGAAVAPTERTRGGGGARWGLAAAFIFFALIMGGLVAYVFQSLGPR